MSESNQSKPRNVESLDALRSSSESRTASSPRRVAAEDLESIVRRAAELQHKGGDATTPTLTEDEVMEIGRQVGLEPAPMRRAMAEARAQSLAPRQQAPEERLFTYLAGTSRVEVRRLVEGDPGRIQRQIEQLLRDQERLKPVRQRAMRSLWERAGGWMAKIERSIDFSGKNSALASASQVDLAVAELEPGWTLVTLGAEFNDDREELLWAACGAVSSCAIASGVVVGLAMSLGTFWGIAAATLVAGVGAVASIPWMRATLDKRRARGEVVLEGLVDSVDRQP